MSAAWMRRAWPGKSMSMVQAHDAAVAGLSTVEAEEVFAVQGEQDAILPQAPRALPPAPSRSRLAVRLISPAVPLVSPP